LYEQIFGQLARTARTLRYAVAPMVLDTMIRAHKEHVEINIADLGYGTGSMLRALAPSS